MKQKKKKGGKNLNLGHRVITKFPDFDQIFSNPLYFDSKWPNFNGFKMAL